MPCACKNLEPDYPITDQWGPTLWTLLHALAERAGKPCFLSEAANERRQWVNLMGVLAKMIPCPKCSEHAAEWMASHPFTDIKKVPEDETHNWIVNYIYQFHEHVNKITNKPSFPEDQLTVTYGRVSVKGVLKSIRPLIETAIRLTGITLFPWQKFVSYVITLSSIYGL